VHEKNKKSQCAGVSNLYRLNSTVLSCRLNALNCISSRRAAGKLFHTRGPATEKLLSLKVLWVRGRKHKWQIELV